ncbi:hypothetical protein [Bradyrhizobium sp. DASA03120]|uniref:hypothetical protein n=1 Tax=Bradyrhizobium sp. SMVTL-02 TaxID=3395917 RepID=UPI003F71FE32
MKVDISQDSDVAASDPGDNSVTVVTDFEVEVIQELEQGPPGPQGTPGAPGKDGNTIIYGTGDPSVLVGNDGDFYINTTTHFLFGPKALGFWPAGVSLVGPQGPRGNAVLYGAADPTAGDGIDGDFWINTTSHFIFGPKAAGAWPAGASLIGPQGPQGIKGDTGQRGSLWFEGAGAPGAIAGALDNDNYLNTTNGDVYNYASGAWGAPVGNIRGPQGIPGAIAEAPTDGAYYTRRNGAWVDAAGAFVRFDAAQALTAAQQLQARQTVYAAPFDAMAFDGMQLNGFCDVSQWNASSMVTAVNGVYVCDNWICNVTVAGMTVGQQATSSAAPFGATVGNAVVLQSSAAIALGAADNLVFRHVIEGQRVARLGWGFANAQPVTIGFWIFSSVVAGTVTVRLTNGAGSRQYLAPVTINAAGVWEYKTVTIPGDVAGTWDKGTGIGLYIWICLGTGTSNIAPAGSVGNWNAGSYFGAPGQTNLYVGGAGGQVAITGLTIIPGSQGPNAAQSPMLRRPFHFEDLHCKRYYFWIAAATTYGCGTIRSPGTAAYWSVIVTPVPMRASPTVRLGTSAQAACGDTWSVLSSMTASLQGDHIMVAPVWPASIGAVGQACSLYAGTTNTAFDARL